MDEKEKGERMLLRYLKHDCFLLTAGCCSVIFDYWPGASEAFERWRGSVDASKPVYVLVSHHHKDHFCREIFDWRRVWPKVHFLISKDVERSVRYMLREGSIYKGGRVPPEMVTVLRPGESYDDGLLRVDAFASTDTGCSYGLRLGRRSLFHAGDLNAWVWKDESTAAEVAAAIRDFEAILETVKDKYPELDLAMFPVDSRIGRDWWEGAARFVRAVDVKRFVPMHFELADNEEQLRRRRNDALAFTLYANPDRGDYIGLSSAGDALLF